jgi:hypothetical protein
MAGEDADGGPTGEHPPVSTRTIAATTIAVRADIREDRGSFIIDNSRNNPGISQLDR